MSLREIPSCDLLWPCLHRVGLRRALRNEHWPLLNILIQRGLQLYWPAQGCCCLPPASLPGTEPSTSTVSIHNLTLEPWTIITRLTPLDKVDVCWLCSSPISLSLSAVQLPHRSTASGGGKGRWWSRSGLCRAPAGSAGRLQVQASSCSCWKVLKTPSAAATSTCSKGCEMFGMVRSRTSLFMVINSRPQFLFKITRPWFYTFKVTKMWCGVKMVRGAEFWLLPSGWRNTWPRAYDPFAISCWVFKSTVDQPTFAKIFSHLIFHCNFTIMTPLYVYVFLSVFLI